MKKTRLALSRQTHTYGGFTTSGAWISVPAVTFEAFQSEQLGDEPMFTDEELHDTDYWLECANYPEHGIQVQCFR